MAQFIKFEKVAFNADWMKTKTFEEFYQHEKHHGISKDKMREFYEAVTGNKEEKTQDALPLIDHPAEMPIEDANGKGPDEEPFSTNGMSLNG